MGAFLDGPESLIWKGFIFRNQPQHPRLRHLCNGIKPSSGCLESCPWLKIKRLVNPALVPPFTLSKLNRQSSSTQLLPPWKLPTMSFKTFLLSHLFSKSKKQQGFSFVEVSMTVVVVGVLTALVTPGVTGALAKARESEAVNSLKMLYTAQQVYHQATDSFYGGQNFT